MRCCQAVSMPRARGRVSRLSDFYQRFSDVLRKINISPYHRAHKVCVGFLLDSGNVLV
jgi:hypothetical protein